MACLGRNSSRRRPGRPDARGWFDKALARARRARSARHVLIEQLVHEKKFSEAAAQYEILGQVDPNQPRLRSATRPAWLLEGYVAGPEPGALRDAATTVKAPARLHGRPPRTYYRRP